MRFGQLVQQAFVGMLQRCNRLQQVIASRSSTRAHGAVAIECTAAHFACAVGKAAGPSSQDLGGADSSRKHSRGSTQPTDHYSS
jgi:hypothetical protein